MSNAYPPRFKGKGPGLVPKVSTQAGKLLKDDGTWATQALELQGEVAGGSIAAATGFDPGDFFYINASGGGFTAGKWAISDGTNWIEVDSIAGLLPAASQAEVNAGTVTGKYVDPATLHGYVEPQLAARAPSSGLHFPAASVSAYARAAAVDVSGSDVFLRFVGVYPTHTTGLGESIIELIGDASPANNRIQLYTLGAPSLSLNIRDTASNTSVLIADTSALEGMWCDMVLTIDASTYAYTLYNLGQVIASGTLSAGQQAAYTAITGIAFFNVGGRSGSYGSSGVRARVEYGNVALTADEVATLHAYGWAALPQYIGAATGDARITSVGRNSDFAEATSDWAILGSSAGVTLNTTETAGALYYYTTGTGTAIRRFGLDMTYVTTPPTAGKQVTLVINASAAHSDLTVSLLDAGSVSVGLSAQSVKVGTNVYRFTCTGTAAVLRFESATTGITRLSSVLLNVGLQGSWDFSTGAGYQQRDLSGAGNRMLLTTTGVSRLVSDERLTVVHDFAFSGTTPLQMLGQPVIPDLNWRLDFITAESDTGVNINMGNASGGSQLVASEALTANTPKELTIVSGARLPTTLNVWGQSSATANVRVAAVYSKINTQA